MTRSRSDRSWKRKEPARRAKSARKRACGVESLRALLGKGWEHGEPRFDERIAEPQLSRAQRRDLASLWLNDHWWTPGSLHQLEEPLVA